MPTKAPGFVRMGGQAATIWFDWSPEPLIVAQELRQFAAFYDNMQPPLFASREVAQADFYEHFVEERSPAGVGWQGWADSYKDYAIQHNVGILWQTGELVEAATAEKSFIVGADDLTYTAKLPHYGIAHHDGIPDRKKGGHLPSRPFIGLSTEAQFEILGIWEAWFEAGGTIFVERAFVLGQAFPVMGRLRTGQPIARTSRGPRFATFSLRH